jgi:translocation and assembly module TamB
MRRSLRIALIVIAIPIVLGVLLWGALLGVGNTLWGRQRIESLVAHLTSNHVRLIGLGGDLPDHLTLRELQLSDAQGLWLRAENLELTWRPLALLERRVAIGTGHVQHIDWFRLPVSNSHKPGHARIPDIDGHDLSADTVNLSAALAGGAPATVTLHASAHLRSLEDMQMAFAATRLDGAGTYALQLAFDRQRMDAAFNVREPAHGPLAGLLGVAAIGAVQVSGELNGPRQAERVTLHADVGALHAFVAGAVDLLHRSADLQYSADAPAMAPRPDLAWQQLHLQGTWHGALATAVAAGDVKLVALTLPDGVRIGALNASLEARAGDLSVRAQIQDPSVPRMPAGLLAGAPLVLDGSMQFEETTRPFQLHVSHPTFDLRAKGLAAGTRQLDADLSVANVAKLLQSFPGGLTGPLRLHVAGQQKALALQLRVTASGNLDSTQATLHPWLRGPESADIRASYAAGEWKFAQSTVANKALSVALSGSLAAPKRPDAPWTTSGKTRIALADLSLLLPALSGNADIRADLSGTTAALHLAGDVQAAVAMRNSAPGTIHATFDLADLPHAPHAQVKLSGQLAAQPLTVQADVELLPGKSVHVRLPHADWQSLHAEGDLTLAQDLDRSQGSLKWSFAKLGDLNQLLGQHLAGSLTGSLNLVPAGAGSPASQTAQTSLQVTTDSLEIGALKVNGTLTGTGPLHALQLALTAQSQILGKPAHVESQARLDIGKSDLQLTALNGEVRGVAVKLLQTATVDFAHGLSLVGLRANLADAVLTASGEIQPQLQLKAELTDATPGLIDAVLPGYLDSGKLHGTLQLQGSFPHPVGEVKFTGTDLRAPGDAGTLPPVQLSATVNLATEGARIELRTSAGDSSHMTVDGTVPWSGPIAVTANGNIDLTRFNPLLESAGRRISGTLEVNAAVAGTLDVPTVKGAVQLHKGAVHDYRHGFDLTEIEGTLEGTQKELRITQLSAHAAAGTISATGTLGVLEGGWPVDMRFTARAAQPFTSSIVTGSVNADLTLQGTLLHELTLAGTVFVNRATVEIPNKFPPNVAVLNVHRPGEQPVVNPTPGGPVVNMKVAVNAPRQILVKGRGLDAELGGTVQIGGTARAPTVDGGFDLQRGLFTLASARLTFSSGRVSFAGSDVTGKIDPTLDFTASTQALDTTVTLRITGVADAPQFELTSVPQLPQDEILARLLFGESAGQLTAIQAAQLGAALVTLTGAGNGLNPLVELQKRLGLDRLAVGSNDTGVPGSTQNTGATIEAGRYVTSRIFVDLKQNTTGSTQLQVDVDLTNKLKLQTQVGTGTATVQGTTPDNDPGSSVGLSYRFEY